MTASKTPPPPSARQLNLLALQSIRTLRRLYPELSLTGVDLLLTVAELRPPRGVLELAEILGIGASTATRTLQIMADGIKGHDGLGLVELRTPKENRRTRHVHLTDAGWALMERLNDDAVETVRIIRKESRKGAAKTARS